MRSNRPHYNHSHWNLQADSSLGCFSLNKKTRKTGIAPLWWLLLCRPTLLGPKSVNRPSRLLPGCLDLEAETRLLRPSFVTTHWAIISSKYMTLAWYVPWPITKSRTGLNFLSIGMNTCVHDEAIEQFPPLWVEGYRHVPLSAFWIYCRWSLNSK